MIKLNPTYAGWTSIVEASSDPTFAHVWVGGARTEEDHQSVMVYAGNAARAVWSHILGEDETAWQHAYKDQSVSASSDQDALTVLLGTLDLS